MKSYKANESDVLFELMCVKKRVSESPDYFRTLIYHYNESFNSLSLAECLWLEKYLPRKGEYCVAIIDGCEKIILRSEALEKGYTIEEYGVLKKSSKVSKPVESTDCNQIKPARILENFL